MAWNSLKSYSGHLNIDPKPYAKYQNPSLSGSQDIVLTRFLWPSRKKGYNFAIQGSIKNYVFAYFLY